MHWPSTAPFALFLSHDIDQIHDRELWRVLADVNHIRRMILKNEAGNHQFALKRIGRSIFRPKDSIQDFETILNIEARHGFHSTFFLLHDYYWARHGARFKLSDPAITDISYLIKTADCEIGLHGGYYRFNNARRYQDSRKKIEDRIGVEIVGIRNHKLRFSHPETWQAQVSAGLQYDCTCDKRLLAKLNQEKYSPFWALSPVKDGSPGLVELPLTLMDVDLFKGSHYTGPEALDEAWRRIEPNIKAGGLVSLLWHNNYFNELEYRAWQWVYEELLNRLSALKPWCATGKEINAWFRSESSRLTETLSRCGEI